MIRQEINDFSQNWLRKAENITGNDLQDHFDKFFTLYVVYNRLYVEATYRLANNGHIKLGSTFPDRKASINYTVQYLTCKKIDALFQNDKVVLKAIDDLKKIIEKNQFNIKLHLVTAQPQPDKDADLLKRMKSSSTDIRICGIVEFIYSIRCNIFHAQKSYNGRQKKVLRPTIIILNKIIEILFQELNNGQKTIANN